MPTNNTVWLRLRIWDMYGYMPIEFNAANCTTVKIVTDIVMNDSHTTLKYVSVITTDAGTYIQKGTAYVDFRNTTPVYINTHKGWGINEVTLDSYIAEIFPST